MSADTATILFLTGKVIYFRVQSRDGVHKTLLPAWECHKCAVKHVYASSEVAWASAWRCMDPQRANPAFTPMRSGEFVPGERLPYCRLLVFCNAAYKGTRQRTGKDKPLSFLFSVLSCCFLLLHHHLRK